MPLKLTYCIAVVSLCLTSVRSAGAATVVFSDSNFANDDWQTQTIVNTATAGSLKAYQSSGGIGDDGYRTNELYMGFVRYHNQNQKLVVANLFKNGVYDPHAMGAIESIQYSMDLSGWRHWIHGLGYFPPSFEVSLLLLQDSSVYEHTAVFFSDTASGWYTLTDGGNLNFPSHIGLPADGFWMYQNQLTKHPDFSANGKPIQFGYLLSFYDDTIDSPTGLGGETAHVDVDNWWVSIQTVPEPSYATLTLLCLITVLLTARRGEAMRLTRCETV